MHAKVSIEPPHMGVPGRRNIPLYRDATKVCIGRGAHNDVVCDDEYVSYEHAVIYWNPSSVPYIVIVDLNSTNGTWVDGERLIPMKPTHMSAMGATISFTHGLQSEDHPEMDHEPWLAHYALLPIKMLKEDWLEEAYELIETVGVPDSQMRLQMVLADIKAQRAPQPMNCGDEEDTDSDATVVPDASPSTTPASGPERPATPTQPLPPRIERDPRALRREPPIHLEYAPSIVPVRDMRHPDFVWSSKRTYIRPSDDDDGPVPPWVNDWSHKYQLPQGLHPDWNLHAKDRYYGKDLQLNLEDRMNEAEMTVREYEMKLAAGVPVNWEEEERRREEEACGTEEAASVECSGLSGATKRKRDTEDEGEEYEGDANDEPRYGWKRLDLRRAPPHPGRFAVKPRPVLRPSRSSHVEVAEPLDDTPSMPGAWIEIATHFFASYVFGMDREAAAKRGSGSTFPTSSPCTSSDGRPKKRLRFSEEIIYIGRVVG
ncbi:hypothetical protein PENSPDRAFT_690707 [Peniophora sp. CONT]|nr:hypothetical protein PENSPDRAFT_690707 [Peniophora sp. CONT]